MGTKSKTFLVAKTGNYGIFVAKFMITCSSIAFEDLLASSIAPQVMPHCLVVTTDMFFSLLKQKAVTERPFEVWGVPSV